jgi:hypothetical protein
VLLQHGNRFFSVHASFYRRFRREKEERTDLESVRPSGPHLWGPYLQRFENTGASYRPPAEG